jgi:hypothetical protein
MTISPTKLSSTYYLSSGSSMILFTSSRALHCYLRPLGLRDLVSSLLGQQHGVTFALLIDTKVWGRVVLYKHLIMRDRVD